MGYQAKFGRTQEVQNKSQKVSFSGRSCSKYNRHIPGQQTIDPENWIHTVHSYYSFFSYTDNNEKSAQRDANTARALAVVRFGHRPPARCKHKHTDRTDYNTLRR